ncbi:TlpA family protein disulfide reductase [Pedobacter sp. Hv1]|uniref:TlpA family protein disulfide reductase n=1 Tax=Pedobacter sp. Hv1 TaxID=1740090 RepID=UPI00351749FC
MPWLQVSDLRGYRSDAALIYSVYEMPTNFLIDQSGKIIAKNLRGEALHKKIKELLGN